MCRNSVLRVAAICLLLTCVSGCGDDYEQAQLGQNSQRWQEAAGMLNELRTADVSSIENHINRYGAPELPEGRRSALAAALQQLADADEAELVRMDAFGDNVYRSTFRLTTNEQNSTITMLLVETDAGLRWAGMN